MICQHALHHTKLLETPSKCVCETLQGFEGNEATVPFGPWWTLLTCAAAKVAVNVLGCSKAGWRGAGKVYLGELCLANTSGPAEHEGSDGAGGVLQAYACPLQGGRH